VKQVAKKLGVGFPTPKQEDRAEQGIGWRPVLEVLDKIPGISQDAIQNQLANLKSSGEYLTILREVNQEVGSERTKRELAAEEKKDEKPDFDFIGVAKILTTPSHVDTFRKLVQTAEVKKANVPITKQKEIAKAIVKEAKGEVSSRFIRDSFGEKLTSAVLSVTKDYRKEKDALLRADKTRRLKDYMHDFSRHALGLMSNAVRIDELLKDWPKGLEIPWTGEMREAVTKASEATLKLKRRLENVK
jgi:uncharacterized membrane-anchored protein YjiN (DUF445 family)